MASSSTLQYSDVTIEAELGTTTVDLSGSHNKATINLEMIVGEGNVFNDPWPIRVMMAKNCTIDLAAWFSTASNEAADYFADWYNESLPIADRTISFYIPQKTVGSLKISGDWVFTGMNIDLTAAATNPIPLTTQLQNNGPITIAPYST